MAPSAPALSANTRLCPFCGKPVSVRLERCPFCREEVPAIRVSDRANGKKGRAKMRQGLLYMLLAAMIHYFAGPYSPLPLSVAVPAFVTTYLTPLLFAAGAGVVLYGVYLYLRS